MQTGTQAARKAANMVDLESDATKLLEIDKQLLITRGALTPSFGPVLIVLSTLLLGVVIALGVVGIGDRRTDPRHATRTVAMPYDASNASA